MYTSDIETTNTTGSETMSKTLHTECLGNGRLVELEVIQDANGSVRFMIEAGGNYGQVFKGTIEEARQEYRRLKQHASVAS